MFHDFSTLVSAAVVRNKRHTSRLWSNMVVWTVKMESIHKTSNRFTRVSWVSTVLQWWLKALSELISNFLCPAVGVG